MMGLPTAPPLVTVRQPRLMRLLRPGGCYVPITRKNYNVDFYRPIMVVEGCPKTGARVLFIVAGRLSSRRFCGV